MGHLIQVGGPLQVPEIASRHSRRLVYALFVLVSSAVSIGIITAVAYWSGHPLVVPSLGPTAFLVFDRSQSPAARPRNIVVGHLIGAAAGYIALVVFGLAHTPSVTQGGLTPTRIGAAALSIAVTTGAMILFGAEHGPAGATTLIVSLGFMTTPASLGLLMAGVVGLAIQGVAIDRFVGLRIPYWSGQHRQPRAHPRHPGPLRSLPVSISPATAAHNGGAKHHPAANGSPRGTADRGQGWVVAPGQGRGVFIGPERCTVKIEDAQTDGSYSVLEVFLDPGTPATLLHAHYTFAETYLVTEGRVAAQVAHRTFSAGPGSIIHIPAGVAHQLTSDSRQPATCLCITPHANQSEPEFLP